MNRRGFVFSLCVLLLFFMALPLYSDAHAAVVINELFPKTEHADEQWIELFNTGSEPVSLDRWKLQGTTGTFMMNASAIIAPVNFLVFRRTETGITLAISGDTVRLYDEKNTLIDSQSYPGTLGYYTAYGRSPDGASGWSICSPTPYYATPGKPNNCPPAPTPTNIPANIPTSSPTPTKKPTPTKSPTPISTATLTPTPPVKPTLVTTTHPTPAPVEFTQSEAYPYLWVAAVGMGALGALLLFVLGKYRRKN